MSWRKIFLVTDSSGSPEVSAVSKGNHCRFPYPVCMRCLSFSITELVSVIIFATLFILWPVWFIMDRDASYMLKVHGLPMQVLETLKFAISRVHPSLSPTIDESHQNKLTTSWHTWPSCCSFMISSWTRDQMTRSMTQLCIYVVSVSQM